MASISNANGYRTIQFIAPDGKRKSIRLGKVTAHGAEEIKTRVERMNAALIGGFAIDGDTAAWLQTIGDELQGKLAAVGLVPARAKRRVPTLGEFLQGFLDRRADAKPNSIKNYKQAVGKLNDFFGESTFIDAITPGKAESFAIDLAGKHSKVYAVRLVKFARQFFHAGIRDKIITENPFSGITPPPQATETREFFVPRAMAQQVLDACPDSEWRLIFALARFGGLRCPSEFQGLTWQDVNWERNRFRVHAPKTEHHDDGGIRWVPIFPELRPHLEEAFDRAEEGAVYVVTKQRESNKNLRTQLSRIIKKAGLTPWPKLFVNLRASRETELAEQFPLHTACAWIGNSPRVAHKHYLQVTEAHFEKASAANSGAVNDEKALQKPVQHPTASVRNEPQTSIPSGKTLGFCEDLQNGASARRDRDYTRQESNL